MEVPVSHVVCGYQLMDTSDWRLWDEGIFRVRFPREYRLVERGGFDSFGGMWRAGDRSIHYDYGSYSNTLTPEALHLSEIQKVCQDATANSTRLVLYRDTVETGSEVVAAYWKDVLPPDVIPIHLMIAGGTPKLDSVKAAEFLTILASMEVGPPGSVWVGELSPILTPDGDTLRPGDRR